MTVVCHHCGALCNDGDRFCIRCGSATSSSSAQQDPLVGRTVGGSYTLQELIGVGGMGRVYRAEQTALGRTVAVKVIHPHLLGDEQTVARFYTEARASSRLNHPNSVSIIDFGRTDDGVLYLVMEFLDGKDLALVMHEEGPLPFTQIADALTGVLGALGEAHALGVVHRDLKPENIIVKRLRSGEDLVKVVDFGLATIAAGQGGTSITSPGLVCGTPDYMSPEQGRGETVDGRADLYALGVVLFELLTDQLPFEDETPTKVVLRHINDPVPNPAEAAPHRDIASSLVEVTMKALAKAPQDRYQSAEEMIHAIRDATRAALRNTPDLVQCAACKAPNPTTMKFCGSCGARLTSPVTALTQPEIRPVTPVRGPSFYPIRESGRPFIGRDAELERLLELRAEAMVAPIWVHLSGEPGVGKTRLLEEVARHAEEEGDFVVGAGPHSSRAPVPYAAIRTLMAALLSVDEPELARLAAPDGVFSEPIMKAGVSELVKPEGLAGFDVRGRVGAVTTALATAVKVAASSLESGRVMLFVDRLPWTDGLTQRVLADLPRHLEGTPLFLVTTGYPGGVNVGEPHMVDLVGFDATTAAAFSSRPDAVVDASQLPSHRRFLPLYLEQVEALGATLDEEALPVRLADALSQRLDRLSLEARRVIQAASVVGDSCSLEYLRKLVDTQDFSGLESVTQADLLRLEDGELVFSHPFIRDIVEGSIPAEARRDLHGRALHLATEFEEPLEVRAEHAYRAGEPMSALMLLERMGDMALQRSDARAAVLAFQRALALGRREMLETGDVMLEGAIVTFSRKLGGALQEAGDVAGADGVLREALDLAGPASAERVRMLLVLGGVAARRDRRRDAVRLLGQALEFAENQKDRDLEAMVQVALARVRREDGDSDGAQAAYGRALLIEQEIGATAERRAHTVVELAKVLTQRGEIDAALERANEARELAREAGAPALMALTLGTLGVVEHHRRNREAASSLYQEAAQSAAEAGDGPSHDRWKAAARSLSSATLKAKGT